MIPTQAPFANLVSPMKATVPLPTSLDGTVTRAPIRIPDILQNRTSKFQPGFGFLIFFDNLSAVMDVV